VVPEGLADVPQGHERFGHGGKLAVDRHANKRTFARPRNLAGSPYAGCRTAVAPRTVFANDRSFARSAGLRGGKSHMVAHTPNLPGEDQLGPLDSRFVDV
jgi:hypothetical protein